MKRMQLHDAEGPTGQDEGLHLTTWTICLGGSRPSGMRPDNAEITKGVQAGQVKRLLELTSQFSETAEYKNNSNKESIAFL